MALFTLVAQSCRWSSPSRWRTWRWWRTRRLAWSVRSTSQARLPHGSAMARTWPPQTTSASLPMPAHTPSPSQLLTWRMKQSTSVWWATGRPQHASLSKVQFGGGVCVCVQSYKQTDRQEEGGEREGEKKRERERERERNDVILSDIKFSQKSSWVWWFWCWFTQRNVHMYVSSFKCHLELFDSPVLCNYTQFILLCFCRGASGFPDPSGGPELDGIREPDPQMHSVQTRSPSHLVQGWHQADALRARHHLSQGQGAHVEHRKSGCGWWGWVLHQGGWPHLQVHCPCGRWAVSIVMIRFSPIEYLRDVCLGSEKSR